MKHLNYHIDFIGIGTGKAATTWISQCLSEHPHICISRPKEISFFLEENYHKGLDWYSSHFKHCKKNMIIGEFSPAYLGKEYISKRIYGTFPNIKLIVSLRNPVERFISSRYYKVAMGRHDSTTIDESTLITYKDDLDEGLYAQHLKNYLRFFSKEQICIVFYEDIKKDPQKVMKEIYTFLGVDNTFRPSSLFERKNVTGLNATKIPAFHKITTTLYRKFTRNKYRDALLPLLKTFSIDKLFYSLREANIRNPKKVLPIPHTIDQKVQKILINYFENDLLELEKITGKNLSMWYKTENTTL